MSKKILILMVLVVGSLFVQPCLAARVIAQGQDVFIGKQVLDITGTVATAGSYLVV
jgi:hypothetical protein